MRCESLQDKLRLLAAHAQGSYLHNNLCGHCPHHGCAECATPARCSLSKFCTLSAPASCCTALKPCTTPGREADDTVLLQRDAELDVLNHPLLNIIYYSACELVPSALVLYILRKLPPKRSTGTYHQIPAQ